MDDLSGTPSSPHSLLQQRSGYVPCSRPPLLAPNATDSRSRASGIGGLRPDRRGSAHGIARRTSDAPRLGGGRGKRGTGRSHGGRDGQAIASTPPQGCARLVAQTAHRQARARVNASPVSERLSGVHSLGLGVGGVVLSFRYCSPMPRRYGASIAENATRRSNARSHASPGPSSSYTRLANFAASASSTRIWTTRGWSHSACGSITAGQPLEGGVGDGTDAEVGVRAWRTADRRSSGPSASTSTRTASKVSTIARRSSASMSFRAWE